jgi:hypothetical protein
MRLVAVAAAAALASLLATPAQADMADNCMQRADRDLVPRDVNDRFRSASGRSTLCGQLKPANAVPGGDHVVTKARTRRTAPGGAALSL